MIIVDAESTHLTGITEIYNEAVLNSTATWNEAAVSVENRAQWLAKHQQAGDPVLVSVDAGGEVLGYASFGQWRPFDGYKFTVEHSVYVRTDQRGRGVGKVLMLELITRARELGKHVMIAGVDSGNTASIRLHEQLGFRNVGTLNQVGAKFGTWLDLTFLQLHLDERAAPGFSEVLSPSAPA